MINEIKAKISDKEYEMMDRYIEDYVSYRSCGSRQILNVWAEAKTEALYQLFGKELILTKEFTYEKSVEDLENDFYSNNEFTELKRTIGSTIFHHKHLFGDCYAERAELTGYTALAKNVLPSWYKTITIENPNTGKTFKLEAGMKTMKALSKVCECIGISDTFEKFRIIHSQLLNQKRLTGELCISIHPFDYMTMSDNNCGWHSCMSWRNEGEYRLGTVEMMNSPYVVVGYLKSANDSYYNWNNKKWRSLYIVDENFITNIKGYPYQHNEFDIEIINWLKELAINNCNYDFKNLETKEYKYSRYEGTFTDRETKEVLNRRIRFGTSYMYNDFGSRDTVFAVIKDYTITRRYDFNYSGSAQCMECGSIYSEFYEADTLICEDCGGGPKCYCENCGDHLYEDDAYWVDGYSYCEYCYNDIFTEDPITYQTVYYDDLKDLFIVKNKEDLTRMEDSFNHLCIRTDLDRSESSREWNLLFNIGSARYDSKSNQFYMLFEDINNFNRVFDKANNAWDYRNLQNYLNSYDEVYIESLGEIKEF